MATWRWSALLQRRVLLLGAVSLMLLPRLLSLTHPFYNVDEATTAVVADVVLDGGVPYRDAVDQRGPVTYYLYAAIFRLAGRSNMTAIHFAHALLLLGLAWIASRLAGRLAGVRAGDWTVVLLSVFSLASPPWDMLAFHIEWSLILFATLGAWLLIVALERDSAPLALAAGVALALAALSKQPALADAVSLLTGLSILSWRHRRSWRLPFCYILGFGLVAGGVGLAFLQAGAWSEFWFNVWRYNQDYFLAAIPASERLGNAFRFAVPYPSRHLLLYALFVFFAFVVLRDTFGRGHARPRAWPTTLVLLFWGASSYAAAMWSGRNFGHYFIQMLPPLCIGAGIGLARVEEQARAHGRAWARRAVSSLILLGLLLPLASPASVLPSLAARWTGRVEEKNPPLDAAQRVAEWLQAHSDAEDEIFVWGYFPEIYVLSGRRPASRYIFCNFLTGLMPWVNAAPQQDSSAAIVPGAWDRLDAELDARRPRFIVDSSPGDHRAHGKYPPEDFPRLWGRLEADYALATRIDHRDGGPSFRVYQLRSN